jgi:hypothetical protein
MQRLAPHSGGDKDKAQNGVIKKQRPQRRKARKPLQFIKERLSMRHAARAGFVSRSRQKPFRHCGSFWVMGQFDR